MPTPAHQQLLPVNSLGNVYVAARYRDRQPDADEHVPYRIMGDREGHAAHLRSAAPPLTGAPATVDGGAAHHHQHGQGLHGPQPGHRSSLLCLRSHDRSAWAIIGKSGTNNEGDPDFVNLVTCLAVPSLVRVSHGPDLQEHPPRLRAPEDADRLQDVTLDCAGHHHRLDRRRLRRPVSGREGGRRGQRARRWAPATTACTPPRAPFRSGSPSGGGTRT